MKNLPKMLFGVPTMLVAIYLLTFFLSCQTISDKVAGWTGNKPKAMYTCPMPEDSVFSDKPGQCPKCGMDLVKMEQAANEHDHADKVVYTCPMPEDSVFSDKPGTCPKCGMDLVKVQTTGNNAGEITLETLLKPTNLYVVSAIPVTTIQQGDEGMETEAFGRIAYDTREVGSISSRVAGRIEKMYVRYRYQKVAKGQHILDIYSPELMTAQQNLLFLLKNDPENTGMLEAAKTKMLLLGMQEKQLQQVMKSGKSVLTIPVYSSYGGHIHESANTGADMKKPEGSMNNTPALTTEGLNLKEGMYLQKGQTVFSVYNPGRAWVILNIPGAKAASVALANRVRIVPETAPEKDFRATVSFIEPYYAAESKTLTVRVYFNNALLKLPIGSQVRATIFGGATYGKWLPADAVLSLGLERIAFVKTSDGFRAQRIETGMESNDRIQVKSGLNETDSVAVNAQYLMDSESFIKVKN
jgi:Cu(I)/Ag(I) efflux system membrane fusion protein